MIRKYSIIFGRPILLAPITAYLLEHTEAFLNSPRIPNRNNFNFSNLQSPEASYEITNKNMIVDTQKPFYSTIILIAFTVLLFLGCNQSSNQLVNEDTSVFEYD